jgi:hypothetical protein
MILIVSMAIVAIIAGNLCSSKVNAGWNVGSAANPTDFLIEVAKGNVPGHSVTHRFGHNTVGTTLTPLTHSGVYQTPTAAVALEIVSSDADDKFIAGDGARTVSITGLLLDGSIVTQVIELTGLTPVSIPIPLWRLLDWEVATTGTYGTTAVGGHQGTLTIRVASAGATWSTLGVSAFASGRSEISWYTVPAGFRAYLFFQSIDIAALTPADVYFMRRLDANIVAAPFTPMVELAEWSGILSGGEGDSNFPVDGLPAFTDMGYMGEVGTGTASISVSYEIMLVKDGY